jgi:pimeloyl-ACP methyl ester carboxylesterase
MVADLIRLLDVLEIDAACFVGFSMGAETLLKLVTLHPDRVLSLVLVGSGWSGAEDLEMYRRVADSLAKSGSFGPLLRELTPDDAPGPTGAEIAAADELLRDNDIDSLVAAARAMESIIGVSGDALRNIGIPVLGIAGENDPERKNLEKMAGVVPRFRMEVLEGRGHLDVLFDSRFNSMVMNFISGSQ